MARALMILPLLLVLGGCASYEADPVSVYQWERKVERIQREDAERVRICATLDKESARYERDCAGVKS
jgi:PBP1b-binding outer membrane lipoprotein LpoB